MHGNKQNTAQLCDTEMVSIAKRPKKYHFNQRHREGKKMIKIEFVLQHLNGKDWLEAAPPNEQLQPVVDYALAIRNSSPATKQRIVRRVIETIDEILIDAI